MLRTHGLGVVVALAFLTSAAFAQPGDPRDDDDDGAEVGDDDDDGDEDRGASSDDDDGDVDDDDEAGAGSGGSGPRDGAPNEDDDDKTPRAASAGVDSDEESASEVDAWGRVPVGTSGDGEPPSGRVRPAESVSRVTADRATGDDEEVDGDTFLGTPPWVKVGGYLNAGFGFTLVPQALPRDEITFGFFGRAGLVVDARPYEMWRGKLNIIFDAEALRTLTDADLVDTNGDGSLDRIFLTRAQIPGNIIQDAWVAFEPTDWFYVRAGGMRIPFTLQQQSSNTATLFPNRSRPNEQFLSGADFGAQTGVDAFDGILLASAGVFAGTSLGLNVGEGTGPVNTTGRGVVFSGRVDVNPFGDFPLGEGGPFRRDFRLGVGVGTLVRPLTLFDVNTGTEPRSLGDLRLAASIRMAWQGVYLSVEYFRRQQTDSISFRPESAEGGYAQAGYFFPLTDAVGLEPIARVGFVDEDQTFDPRLIGYLAGGLNLYPVTDVGKGDGVRLTVQYLGQRRFTEVEEAHAVQAALRFKF
ncbi:MAG: porin [Myxococcota bacterium]